MKMLIYIKEISSKDTLEYSLYSTSRVINYPGEASSIPFDEVSISKKCVQNMSISEKKSKKVQFCF